MESSSFQVHPFNSLTNHRKQQKYDEARAFFINIHLKQIDWPEAIWEAWLTFEQLHGNIININECSVKVLQAQYFNNDRRAKVCTISRQMSCCILIQLGLGGREDRIQVATGLRRHSRCCRYCHS